MINTFLGWQVCTTNWLRKVILSPKSWFWGRISGGRPGAKSRRTSGGKNFSQALEILENKRFGADVHDSEGVHVHDPRAVQKTSVRKTSG